MKKIVFGLCGGAQHGKDTAANYLKSKIKGSYQSHLAFADLLKEQAKYLGWDGEKDEGGRTFLQKLSRPIKDYGNWLASKGDIEKGNDNYYTSYVYNTIKNSTDKVFFITDFRFLCEYEYLKSKEDIDFRVIKIIRTENGKYFTGGLSEKQLQDPSENEWKQIPEDILIENNSTLESFYKLLDERIVTKC